ncbi:MAG: hypothetical protein IPL23_10695 [Saprospiraceae bacterium]|nr:hypothetical protein [Saprospiraceae bacterium]
MDSKILKTATFAVLILMLIVYSTNAQNSKLINQDFSLKGDVSLIGKWHGNQIKLRWGFDHPQLWYHHLKRPISLYRRNVTKNGKYEKLADILPMDSTGMEQLAFQTKDEMLVVSLENIHRNWSNTNFDSYANILEKNDNFHNRWSLTHLAADRSFAAAKASGLGFLDTPPNSEDIYAYKIAAEGNAIISDYKVIYKKKDFAPAIFEIIEAEEKVIINWDKNLHDYHFTAYWIETSTDGINFKKSSDVPFIQMVDVSVKDERRFYSYSLPVSNYQKTFIRLIGIDPFGDESLPSSVEIGMGRDKTPPPPAYLIADSSKTHLTKSFTIIHDSPQEVASYHLERTFGNETIIIKNWLDPKQTVGIDSVSIEGIYKYRIIAVDSAGNEAHSPFIYAKMYDLLPPAKAPKLQAIPDTSGVISLYWEAHPESDIIGYNVYAADGKQRNFTKLNNHIHRLHVYLDTISLALMNEKRYYYIVAVDNDYMLSPASDTLEVKRPDKMPPAPAHIANYEVTDTSIRLTIFPSSSRDVVKHELWRKEADKPYELLANLLTIPPYYEDKSIAPSTKYTYHIVAIDELGLKSKAVKEIHLLSKNLKAGKPSLNLNENDGVLMLGIISEIPTSENVIVFKSVNDGPYERWTVTDTFPIKDLAKGKNKVAYRAAYCSNAGLVGPLSDKIIWTSKTN